MFEDSPWQAGYRPTRTRDLAPWFLGTVLAGATAGLGVAAATARTNPSLRDSMDSTWFLAAGMLLYTVVLLPVGGLGLVATRWILRRGHRRESESGTTALALDATSIVDKDRVLADGSAVEEEEEEVRVRGLLFARHLLNAGAGFAGYVFAQWLCTALLGWSEVDRPALLAGILVGCFSTWLCAIAVTRTAFERLLRNRSWFLPVVLGFVNGFFVLLGLGGSEDFEPPERVVHAGGPDVIQESGPLPLVAPDHGPRVVFLALDGADWARIDPLIAKGRMPSLKHLMDRGVRARLESERPTWQSVAWTTMATGRAPLDHGVCDNHEVELPLLGRGIQRVYEKRGVEPLLPAGFGLRLAFETAMDFGLFHEVPVGSSQRGAKAVWNVLAEAGYPAAVVRWPASYPAEALAGWVIANDDTWTGDLVTQSTWRRGEPTAELVWPPKLLGEMHEVFDHVRDGGDFDFTLGEPPVGPLPVLYIDEHMSAEERAELERDHRLREEARLFVTADLFSATSALELWKTKQPSFLAVYMRSIYALSRRLEDYPGAADAAYAWIDQYLGAWLDVADERTLFVIASAYGIESSASSARERPPPPGVLVISGPGVRRNVEFDGASIYDVAPTLLALYGEPASLEMPGRPLLEALSPAARLAIPERPASFGPYHPTRSEPRIEIEAQDEDSTLDLFGAESGGH